MKRTLIATLVATAFAAPVHASPRSFVEDILSAVVPGAEDTVVITSDLLAAADQVRIDAETMAHDIRNNVMTFYGPRMSSSRVVKGAPYSAEVITETRQALPDGNEISKRTVGAVYRDGEGRTRQESGIDGKKHAVYISDPVDSRSIVLMPESKRAIVRPQAFTVLKQGGEVKEKHLLKFDKKEIRIEDGKVFLDGKEVSNGRIDLKSGGKDIRVEDGKVYIDGKEVASRGHPRTIVRSVDEKETGDGTRREEIRVQVVRSGDKDLAVPIPPIPPTPPVARAPIPPIPPLPLAGMETMRFESTARLGKGVTTQLGAKDFDGVRAEGRSTVWTIPAGEIGNRNPIMITSESWYSPDLKVTVYSRYHDPRTGESIYRLANIRRAEPAKSLFSVPEGYDAKGTRTRERDRG